ncbi:aspartate 1-decarboxylase [Halolactibacillus miurensis]|uniref:Aspartate 1-decarboxylase n=1 Tax=Halolactibacillus miurensis TaxID=306541 RepID=A0A1I6SXN9_9BACI|nr:MULTISPECIES: aspartate 1-decarboxylase [Halolactibacillus]GEM04292.1 aspartate 1-decarboxylase [Halolactibacillus miurensis]SFS81670.1 L-aspartate 1-decarboxylase [Halolactibacillus miurensis]
MFRTLMKGKLHRARVTEANLNYVGSITIDQALMEAIDLLPHEKVQIVNNNNGARLETYVIPGKRHSGVICLNGAASRLVQPGDIVIIVSYALVSEEDLTTFTPKVAILNEDNTIKEMIDQEAPRTIIE